MRIIDGDALKRRCQKVATEAWKMKMTASVETVMNQLIDFIEEAPTIQPDAPRVMTLEELDDLRGRGRAVWFENRDSSAKSQDVFFVVANDLYADLKGETYSMFEMVNDYMQTWRCWTDKPTAEEMEAIPWKE